MPAMAELGGRTTLLSARAAFTLLYRAVLAVLAHARVCDVAVRSKLPFFSLRLPSPSAVRTNPPLSPVQVAQADTASMAVAPAAGVVMDKVPFALVASNTNVVTAWSVFAATTTRAAPAPANLTCRPFAPESHCSEPGT